MSLEAVPQERALSEEDLPKVDPPNEPVSKKARRESKDFHARFSQCITYKNFCEIIGNILKECYFQIVAGGENQFSGLTVESIDAPKVCMVQGRLTADVSISDGDGAKHYCVNMVNIQSCLKNVHPQHFLDIWRDTDGTDLVMHVFEPDVHTYTPTFKIKTLAKENEYFSGIDNLVYPLTVEIETISFRNAVKTAKEHKADHVIIEVSRPKVRRSETHETAFFVLRYNGEEVSSTFPFQSSTEKRGDKWDGVVRASENVGVDFEDLPPESELDIEYKGVFGVEYLCLFVKNMERHTLTLRLANDSPMVLQYPLGCGLPMHMSLFC